MNRKCCEAEEEGIQLREAQEKLQQETGQLTEREVTTGISSLFIYSLISYSSESLSVMYSVVCDDAKCFKTSFRSLNYLQPIKKTNFSDHIMV